MPELRILQVAAGLPNEHTPWLQPFVASQITSLQDSGISVEILNLAEYCGSGWKKYLRGILEIRKRVRENHFDLIHAHYSYCGWVARAQMKAPVIVSLMGSDLLGTPEGNGRQSLRGYFDILLSQILVHLVDHIIVKSEAMKRKLTDQKKVSVIPNGVDFKLFKPLDRDWSRRSLGIAPDAKVVLFAANPDESTKNSALARLAVQELQHVFGGTCSTLFFWKRGQEEVPIAMNAADVLLFTSYWEGSPNIIKEAMACNLPIVSVNVGDVPEIISGTKNCFLASYNAADIASKLKLVLEMGERSDGRQHIEHLRLEIIAERLIETYEHVLQAHSVVLQD